MLATLLHSSDATETPGKLFWGIVILVVLAQIAAIWVLCSQQVRKAQARDASVQVGRTAVADCLQYIPKATQHKCATRIAAGVDAK